MSRRADGKPVVRARDRNLTGRPGCDNTSVGVLITRDDGRYLMPVRAARPAGIAPPGRARVRLGPARQLPPTRPAP